MTNNNQRIGAIGLDIGGTKTAAGIVLWPTGEILHRTINPTNPQRGGEAVLDDPLALAMRLRQKAEQEEIKITAIGTGVAELVDCDGNVTSSCTIAWRGLPVYSVRRKTAPCARGICIRPGDRKALCARQAYGICWGLPRRLSRSFQ